MNLPAAPASLFRSALHAARDAAGSQDYPQGTLYVVATPIGNLADITLRALHVLERVDAIACEDTRHTQALLRAYGIDRKAGAQLLALHQHNEAEAAQGVVERLARGERIAYVSDAGTPGVSDPGARLAAAVRAAGHRVLPLPGASSVTTLISAAGLAAAEGGAAAQQHGAFVFAGFLPSKAAERDNAIQQLAAEPRAVVLLEAPHRILTLFETGQPSRQCEGVGEGTFAFQQHHQPGNRRHVHERCRDGAGVEGDRLRGSLHQLQVQ